MTDEPFVFVVDGKAVPKARPRLGRNSTYTPKSTVEYERQVQAEFLAAGGRSLGDTCGVSMRIDVFPTHTVVALEEGDYDAVPRTRQGKRKGLPNRNAGDLDNIAKAISDALNELAYGDDVQVVRLLVVRHQDE